MTGDEGVEHAVAEDGLQPQPRLHAALAVDGGKLRLDRRAHDLEAQRVANLQPQLVRFAVFHRNQWRPAVVEGSLDARLSKLATSELRALERGIEILERLPR